jgi:hypothetical protein
VAVRIVDTSPGLRVSVHDHVWPAAARCCGPRLTGAGEAGAGAKGVVRLVARQGRAAAGQGYMARGKTAQPGAAIGSGRIPGLAWLTFAEAGSSDADGLLPILEIGNKPLVMRCVASTTIESATIESVWGRRHGSDVYVGTGCLHSPRRYRNASED